MGKNIRHLIEETVKEIYKSYGLSEKLPRIVVNDGSFALYEAGIVNEWILKILVEEKLKGIYESVKEVVYKKLLKKSYIKVEKRRRSGIYLLEIVISPSESSEITEKYIFPSYSQLLQLLKIAFPNIEFKIVDRGYLDLRSYPYIYKESKGDKLLKEVEVYLPFLELSKLPDKTCVNFYDLAFIATNKGLINLPLAWTKGNKIEFYVSSNYHDKRFSIPIDDKDLKCLVYHEVIGHYLPEKGVHLKPYSLCLEGVKKFLASEVEKYCSISLNKEKCIVRAFFESLAECSACVEDKDCIEVLKNLREKEKEKRKELLEYRYFTYVLYEELNKLAEKEFNKKIFFLIQPQTTDCFSYRFAKLEYYFRGIEIAKRIYNENLLT